MELNPKHFPWMRDASVMALFDALPKGSLRFVGGCVRNALWGVDVGDIDLACQLEPAAVVAALKGANIRHVPTGTCAETSKPTAAARRSLIQRIGQKMRSAVT